MKLTLDVAAIATALAWPVVITIFVLRYRAPIERLLRSDTVNVQFPLMGFSVQLATASSMSQDPFAEVFRHPTSYTDITDNIAGDLEKQLEDDTPATYAVVNLGQGREWLTSRLYILALLLLRMRDVRIFVFVESDEVQKRFVGFAATSGVRWALAQRFLWLEEAFAYAYTTIMRELNYNDPNFIRTPPPNLRIVSREGKVVRSSNDQAGLGSSPASQIFSRFLLRIQRKGPPPVAVQEWVPIPDTGMFERSQWLDAFMVRDLLGKDLIESCVRSTELRDKNSAEQVRTILSESTRYVAQTGENGEFEELIDRQPLFEEVLRNVLRETERSKAREKLGNA